MNLDAYTMNILAHLLLIMHEQYEGREVTVVDNGLRVVVWLTERPEIYVNIDKEYNQPVTGANNPEVAQLVAELLDKTSSHSAA